MPKSLPASVVRELDRVSIEERGVPSLLLMENAGRAVAAVVARFAERGGAAVQILIGPGNNGGDGFVIARTLLNRGYAVRTHFVGSLGKLRELSDDMQTHARMWRDLKQPGADKDAGRIVELSCADDAAAFERELKCADVVVDAMFGTGLVRELRSPWREVVLAVNAARQEDGLEVVAVDVPSGLQADTGEVLGVAIEATRTVTFVAPKDGFFEGAGPAHVGVVTVAEIGIPRDLVLAALRRKAEEDSERHV